MSDIPRSLAYMPHPTSPGYPGDGRWMTKPYRVPERSAGSRALGCLAAILLVPLMLAALGIALYVETGVSTAQQLSETKKATVQELLMVSEQRETLLPEPTIIARIGLKELSRISWISCKVSGRGLGLGTTQYDQTCYLTRYIYLDPGPGRTSAEQFDWAAGRTSSYGCEQRVSPRGVEESIVFYPDDCARASAPSEAMATQGDVPGLGSPVVSVRSFYDFDFYLGCKAFSILCDSPVSEPIRI
jgi:hypothetical protein